MSATPDLFPGFAERRIKTTQGVEIYLRTGGSGPPLLALHGYPQTHVAWHRIAPELARQCSLVIADLRGYGASSAPPGDAEHHTYSKRAMADDCLSVMRALGHERFMVAGHDRGGRVAYRLALDHADTVSALIPIDILPTADVWRRTTAESMLKSYHWAFLAQPSPMPETLIAKDPVFYLEHTLKSWAKPRDLSPFAPASAGTLSGAADRPCPHSCGLRGLSRRRHHRPAARRSRPCRRPPNCVSDFVLWARSYLPGDSARRLADLVHERDAARRLIPAISSPRKIRRTRWPRSFRSSSL